MVGFFLYSSYICMLGHLDFDFLTLPSLLDYSHHSSMSSKVMKKQQPKLFHLNCSGEHKVEKDVTSEVDLEQKIIRV